MLEAINTYKEKQVQQILLDSDGQLQLLDFETSFLKFLTI